MAKGYIERASYGFLSDIACCGGASTDPGKYGGIYLSALLGFGYVGEVYL